MNTSLTILLGIIGGPEIIIIAIVILVLFGGRKIPELMRGLGRGVKEFKDASNDTKESDNEEHDDSDNATNRKKDNDKK